MRIDKYLKVSRIIKRRTIAKDILDLGLVKINNKVAKPSSEVKNDDVLTLKLGERELIIKVKIVQEYAKKGTSSEMYEILEDKNNF
ncbi:MAG: RNA-binding S4 domain-containing protein [Bacillales bacterium]|nr:RNA-binding S4 domain-containing protein [Bacillales bacterium]